MVNVPDEKPAPRLGKLTKDEVLQCYSNVFMRGHGSPLGTPMHIELDPNVRPVYAQVRRVLVAKLDRVNEKLERLSNEGIKTSRTSDRLALKHPGERKAKRKTSITH